jgi:putative flavoprotein involved in K+ transport
MPASRARARRIAERWRTERWDGLRFQFPNWSVKLPDFPFPHADPDGFATSEEIVDYPRRLRRIHRRFRSAAAWP